MRSVFTFLLMGISFFVNSQNNIFQVKVTDAVTGKPVEYAHVQLKPLAKGRILFQVTDKQGIAAFDATGRFELTVSFLGYETFHDTITANKKVITIPLHPGSVAISVWLPGTQCL